MFSIGIPRWKKNAWAAEERGVKLMERLVTLPKTDIALENSPSQKANHVPSIHFQGQGVSFRDGRLSRLIDEFSHDPTMGIVKHKMDMNEHERTYLIDIWIHLSIIIIFILPKFLPVMKIWHPFEGAKKMPRSFPCAGGGLVLTRTGRWREKKNMGIDGGWFFGVKSRGGDPFRHLDPDWPRIIGFPWEGRL